VSYRQKHLLAIEGLHPPDIGHLLDLAESYVLLNRSGKTQRDLLRGRTLINLFFEDSTRTRTSFEIAGKRLGADVINMSVSTSSVNKGETLLDTAATLNAMHCDLLVVRHDQSGAPNLLAQKVDAAVINAGDGTHEHPTQALLDALTIRDRTGKLEDLHVTILGDILHSRVARSNIHLLSKFGAAITLCGPAMWVPREFENLAPNVRRVTRIEDALNGADAIIVLRVQTERIHEPAIAAEEYILGYQLTPERLRLAKPDAIVLHPGPMIRGLEIDPSVADGPQSCVLEQVTNGLAVRMALLYHLVGGAPTDAPHPAGSNAVSTSESSSSSGAAKGSANAAD
jgi:aspartate carbamoyltransferase catalytic subunit